MDFVVLKINDASGVCSRGSIQIFNPLNEPVIVRVRTRMDPASQPPPPPPEDSTVLPPSVETVSTQTDRCDDADFSYEDIYDGARFVEVPLTELDLRAEMEAEEDLNRTLEFEYEEVTLTRTGIDQKVGLTLCYGSACDEITDIYVGEVDPVGIAAKDGRIREGDQILQINGCDVHTRQEAVRMFSDSRATITLLLARPAIQMDDGFMDIYNSLDDLRNRLDIGMDGQNVLGPAPSKSSPNQRNCHVDIIGNTDSQMLDRKTAAPSCDDIKYEQNMSEYFAPKSSCPLGGGGGRGSEFDRPVPDACFTYSRSRSYDDGPIDIDSEIDALNREMQRIQLQYQEIVNAHRTTTAVEISGAAIDQQTTTSTTTTTAGGCFNSDAVRSPRMVPRMGTRLDYIRQLHLASEHLSRVSSGSGQSRSSPRRVSPSGRGQSEQDTSAYHTGESCRSTPAAAAELLLRTVDDSLDTDDCVTEKANSCVNMAKGMEQREDETVRICFAEERSTSRTSQTTSTRIESLQRLYNQYIDVMYTNKANLQHTIMVQQNLFQQQLTRSAQNHKTNPSSSPGKPKPTKISGATGVPHGDSGAASASQAPCPSGTSPQCPSEMEWVVKRRADGSRYITRRPVRNRLLKERARKVAEERCGLTTDDDAISELKVGRYWSKEDRKRHLEKARDHRRQKELLMRQQLENNRDKPEVKELNAVELGHRKHLKHKSKKVLDDFTTIQELLVHGSRDVNGKAYNALLSVTTV